MGSETNSPTPSPSGKRSRDPEDEVYVDNLHSHKRYLSEMMASSLNGLTVGDAMPETIMDSPARSESMFYLREVDSDAIAKSIRDEMSLQYSPMSEDLDDLRYCETPMSACSSQSESRPTSPVSPYRYKPLGAFCCSPPRTALPSNGCSAATGPYSQPRQRGSDTDGRFPSSPSDICHSSDLRKTALLRSVQMRAQPSCSSSFDLGFTGPQEPLQNIEVETRSCSYMKPLDDVRDYHVDSCSPMASTESGFPAAQLSMRNNGAERQSCSYMKPLDDEQDYHLEGCSSMVSSEPGFSAVQEPIETIEAQTLSCSYMKPLEDEQGYHVEGCSSMGSSEPIYTTNPEPMLSIGAEPLSCSYMKPSDDGHK